MPRPSGAVLLHPGQDYQCRCTAIAYWQELVGEADEMIAQYEELDILAAQNITAMSKSAPSKLPPATEIGKEKIKETEGQLTTLKEGHILNDPYSQERKNTAIWAKNPKAADDALRGGVWRSLEERHKSRV
jgi:uncharacterized protein with gpF-like domain